MQIGGLSVALVDAITRALDEATAEAEKRAQEAEADAAAHLLRLRDLAESFDRDDGSLEHEFEIDNALERACEHLAIPHPGASLLAELEAAREQNERYRKSIEITDRNFRALQARADAARELIDGDYFRHDIGCAANQSHGNACDCGMDVAITKYDAARGAR